MSHLARAPSTATDISTKPDLEKHEPGLAHISEDELDGATMDDAAHTLAGQNIAFTPEEERRLRRKLDWRLAQSAPRRRQVLASAVRATFPGLQALP